ncbi:MAG: PSD1 and planctomycete cytochrome C domain-containing protein [Verrucomicrobiota bacterium]
MKVSRLMFALTIPAAAGVNAEVDFNRDIRPILSANCFACHGFDEEARKGKLRLDTVEGAKAVLGSADDSELIYRVETDDPIDLMPPADTGHVLTAEQKRLLRKWVASGGDYDVHWAFTPPTKAEVPKGNDAIDYFVAERLKEENLTMSAEEDRYRLIRRVSLGLTGLPPTIEAADAFVESGDFEAVVDALLESPAFGEHWARTWLDLARYADTKGYEKDKPRTIWRYRDWVIEALNQDMPYDQFTIEQLAGDLLPEPKMEQLLATAFHRNTMENEEGGTDNEEFRVAAVKDRVDTTMQVWMGLTMACAKCHSHKYDPISQEDYYRFYAFFNQTEDADREPPLYPTPTAEQSEQVAKLEAEVRAIESAIQAVQPEVDAAFDAWKKKLDAPLWQELKLVAFESEQGIVLKQAEDGRLFVEEELPEKDAWELTLQLPAREPITAIRLETIPKAAGGKWNDKNVVLSELTAELVNGAKLKLINPRADFSQRNWKVAKAIDGNPKTGWAFSPKAAKPHAAVFDFAEPLPVKDVQQLRLSLKQDYGQGLVFDEFRLLISTRDPKSLSAELNPEAGLKSAFIRNEFPATRELYAKLDESRKKLDSARKAIPQTPILRELAPNKQRETRIHSRGNFLDQGELVEAGIPTLFGQLPDDAPRNRLGVAQWLTQADNPLTARVMVNRVWARLFGTGIVETEEDFGSQGTPPSHPQLLDWLAVEYQENGWSLKHLLKTIVMSQTYRQSSAVTEEMLALDPRNRLFTRGPRFRLSAEMVRDQALAVSGLLTEKIGGPSVMPPQPPGIWKSTYSGLKWQTATGPDRYRRGLYTYLKRTSPHPAMLTFDAGSGEVCQVRRVRTNTPLQALVTMNDPAFIEAAGALSQRMTSIEHGFRLVLTRPPTQDEAARLVLLHDELKEHFAADETAAREFLESARMEDGDAAMVAVASVLLNLDESLMK